MIKTTIYQLLAVLMFSAVFSSCKKMDDSYKEFLVEKGIVYPGKASSPVVYVGRNRVKISWLRGSDASVTKAKVFWNNYADSLEVPIPPSGDTISVVIGNLPEKTYAFVIKTYDANGNTSVPVEVLTAVYGDNFQAALLSRPLTTKMDDAGKVTIAWGPANISGGAYATEIKYLDPQNTERLKRVSITDDLTEISDIKPGTAFNFRTLYLPKSLSIDTFYTAFEENEQYLYEKTNWSVLGFSTQHAGAENLATNIIDGRLDTRWHTISNTSSKYPHFVTVDMKAQKNIRSFEIFRRAGDDRGCDTFKLWVSQDNSSWTDLGTFNFNRLTDVGQLYEIPSQPVARYFKFEGLTGPNGFMVMGEINVYGL